MSLTSRSLMWVMMVQHKTSDQYLTSGKVSTRSIHGFKRYRLLKTLTKNFNILSDADANADALGGDSNEYTHNICFYGELTKNILQLSSNTLLICSSVNSKPCAEYIGGQLLLTIPIIHPIFLFSFPLSRRLLDMSETYLTAFFKLNPNKTIKETEHKTHILSKSIRKMTHFDAANYMEIRFFILFKVIVIFCFKNGYQWRPPFWNKHS